MNTKHTFYIDERASGEGHFSLNGKWQFIYTDTPTDTPETLDFPYTATLPSSAFNNLEEADVLPDSYIGTNSKLYAGMETKIWYYTRTFFVPAEAEGKDVFLCFDGVGYLCRVWLNGELLCSHEGMFGGPIAEIGEKVRYGAENTLTVEVTPPYQDFCRGKTCDKRSRPQIVPWNIRRDASCTNGDFTTFGIWRNIRLEIVPKKHLSRPYLYTEAIEDGKARLRFSVEIADEQIRELDVRSCDVTGWAAYQNTFVNGCTAKPTGKKVNVRISLTERTTGRTVYDEAETVDIFDKNALYPDSPKYWECQFYERNIEIENPALWYPIGLGEPSLYDVTVQLSEDGKTLDTLRFATGIRLLTYARSAGLRTRTRWENWQFVINGKPFFVKGMNWMPEDFLYTTSDESYRWALEEVANLGVQVLRVWSGGGMPEDDRFYDLCDRLGILVMQDNFIANQTSEEWDREVLAGQVCRNLYRIRNHVSLGLHTGGNENNPYALGNDACMSVISREIADLDPARLFWRTTPDKGSAHIYRDMEPVWYRKSYSNLPFIGESGIHSCPNAKSLRQLICAEEYNRPLSNIFSEEFKTQNPEFYNHFSEFVPSRIPRMLARASMVNSMTNITVADLCEATQFAAYEYYQMMINAMRENAPVTCGVMPWVFKRPYATVAIQLVDGLGEPTVQYYAVKNAYAPLMAELALTEVTYAVGESIAPDLLVLSDGEKDNSNLSVGWEVYSPKMEKLFEQSFPCEMLIGENTKRFAVSSFVIPSTFREMYFFLRAYTACDGKTVHQSFYPCKVLARMEDPAFRAEYRASAKGNIFFDKGPYLKPQLQALQADTLTLCATVEQKEQTQNGERWYTVRATVTDKGGMPVYPVVLSVYEDKTLSYASDNGFFLNGEETKEILLTVRVKNPALSAVTLQAAAWNAEAKTQILPLT